MCNALVKRLINLDPTGQRSFVVGRTLLAEIDMTPEAFQDSLQEALARGWVNIADDLPGVQHIWLTRQ